MQCGNPASRNQRLIAGRVALGVVDGLQLVQVEDHERERPCVPTAARDLGVEVLDERAPVEQVRQGIMVGEEAHLLELFRRVQGGRRLVREHAQRLQALGGRHEAVLRVVRPDEAHRLAVAFVQRHEQPVMVPRVRPATVALRAVLDVIGVDPRAGLVVRDEIAARDLEVRIEQRAHRVERHRTQDCGIVHFPAGRRA